MTKCLYITSPSFSGSTLLTLLLAQHPDIATIGEMKGGQENMATYRCSCGALFKECQFWRALISDLKEIGFSYDLGDRNSMPVFHRSSSTLNNKILGRSFGPVWFEVIRDLWIRLNPVCRQYLAQQLEYNQSFIQHLLKMTGKSVFLDSSKDPIRIKYLSQIPSLKLYVLQLIRDGRAVVNSHRKNVGMTIAKASREWSNTHSEIENIAQKYARERFIQVKYEELCYDPAGVLKKIFGFMSLSTEATITTVDGSKLHVLGNRMRLKGFQTIKQDLKWKATMHQKELAEFNKIAGPIYKRLSKPEKQLQFPR